ncbi:MAG: hypothetical protein O3A51_12105, partial [Verrucomicrobia bacterium]|nr:hypothetical protein [Verrucomicrobiota bacterium]
MKRLPCRPDRWGVSPLRVLAIAGCLVVLPLRGVQAERIAMAVSSRVVGTNLILQINNQGDAVARNVSVEVSFDGVDIDSRPIAVVSPQSSFGASMDLHVPAMPGNYPALVRLHFEDENAYPFSSTIVQTVPFGMQRSSPITLTLAATSVRGRTTLPLILVNRGDKPITATVRVLGAVELMIRASAAPKIIPPDGV